MSDKPIVRIVREPSTDDGTFGKLTIDGRTFSLDSLELPWRNNDKGLSSIPEGTYECSYEMSPRFKRKLYRLADVPGRAGILIHVGNYGGDKTKGKRTDIEGCILLGKGRGVLNNQNVVISSKVAMDSFEREMKYEPFTLIISSKK